MLTGFKLLSTFCQENNYSSAFILNLARKYEVPVVRLDKDYQINSADMNNVILKHLTKKLDQTKKKKETMRNFHVEFKKWKATVASTAAPLAAAGSSGSTGAAAGSSGSPGAGSGSTP